MDYQAVIDLVVEVVKHALPIGVIFLIAERAVNMFLAMAFPKTFKGGI